ncbi:MAG: hypothetical protein ACYS0E_07460 [Planctomycetota bacterium]|jgi:hypothetical protein
MGRVDGILLLLLAATGCASKTADATRIYGSAGDYLPFRTGQSWVYEIRDGKGSATRLTAVLKGGDTRSIQGGERVRFRFVYGTPAGMDHDVTKSIYALPSTGPCEYYFDAMTWSLWHDPPIPLLPPVVAAGNETTWSGKVEYDDDEIAATARIRVERIESVELESGPLPAVRTVTVYGSVPLVVTRWFSKNIGLVRMEMRVADSTVLVNLLSYATADADPG